VKTSTGYGFVKQADGQYNYKGATMEHLKLMRKHTAPHIQIKAAGGVRTLDDLLAMREIGVVSQALFHSLFSLMRRTHRWSLSF
jgi:deoxyribose-phosphate aldolase